MGAIRFFKNYYKALRYNQFSESQILKIQEKRFRRLLNHTVKNSKFYQDLYSGIDIENCRLQDLPTITKSTMMDNFDLLVTDPRLKLREVQEWLADKNKYGKIYLGEFLPIPTSGTSGKYALVIYDRNSLSLTQAGLFARHPLSAKRSVYDQTKVFVSQLLGAKVRVAAISIPRGNLLPIVKNPPPFHRIFGKLMTLSVFDPIEQNVATLNKFQPDALFANSFYLADLAQEQLSGKLNIAFNRTVSFLAGGAEPLTEHVKGLALKAWNREIQDDYGAAECYFMAASCQEFGRLHTMSDLCILEAVDGDNNSVPPGEYGEKVLLTNLANFTQPIIRYELEDIVGYANQSCECGLPFPALLPIQGRKMDFLYFQKPQGGYERIHPYRLRTPLFYVNKLNQYQLVQTARNELTFLYIPRNSGDNIEQQIRIVLEEALMQAGLESRVSLKLKQVETIPRNERSGKFQIVKSLGAPSGLDTKLDTSTH